MEKIKKTGALALVLSLLLTIWPAIPVSAETSGSCGDNLAWTLDDECTLTISGTGKMKNYEGFSPWQNMALSRVVIEEGVTSIGNWAFVGCESLRSISLPDSLTCIGDDAFSGCVSLAAITIPKNVTSLGETIFFGCCSLAAITVSKENLVFSSCEGALFNKEGTRLLYCAGGKAGEYAIPDGVTAIADAAFMDCLFLTGITIPKSVTDIEEKAFFTCYVLETITVSQENPAYSSDAGVLFDKNKTKLIRCPETKSGTYEIPDSVTEIGCYAFFDCRNLTAITIPNSVTTIEDQAFSCCFNLTSLNVPEDLIYLGDSAFSACMGIANLTIPQGITYIPWGAFSNCENLTSLTISQGVVNIGPYAFDGCLNLDNVTISENVTGVSSGAFQNCFALTSVTIPASVDTIGDHAFGYYSEKYSSELIPVPGFTITGYRGTAAEAYARGNGFKFVSAEQQALVKAQGKVDSGLYTPESVAGLEKVIEAARAVLEDESATREEIYDQMSALQAALEKLELIYPHIVWGDVDGTGEVTPADALMALQAATGKIILDDEQTAAANVDGHGKITSADALLVLQYATKKIRAFPVMTE